MYIYVYKKIYFEVSQGTLWNVGGSHSLGNYTSVIVRNSKHKVIIHGVEILIMCLCIASDINEQGLGGIHLQLFARQDGNGIAIYNSGI